MVVKCEHCDNPIEDGQETRTARLFRNLAVIHKPCFWETVTFHSACYDAYYNTYYWEKKGYWDWEKKGEAKQRG